MEQGDLIAQRYRLERKLGEGGMGTVYEAVHVVTGRRLAVKVLERRDKIPAEAVDRFLREAGAPAKIGHPNIVDVIDAGTEPDGTAFIAMELLEGEGLDEMLRRERVIQPAELSRIMDQLLAGLDAMHARGLVHRDLKPANIFLVRASAQDGTPRVKLLDFGIAKALGEDSVTRSGYVIGTPAYMAPEQMRNARSATPRSDLWSVGVMLYESLVGHRPFRGETFGILAQISGPEPHVPIASVAPHLPHELADLVDALLNKDPNRRPASAARVRVELLAALLHCPPVRAMVPPDVVDEGHAPGPAPAPSHSGDDSRWLAEPPLVDDLAATLASDPVTPGESDAIPLERSRSANGTLLRIAIGLVAVAAAVGAGARAWRTPSAGQASGHGHASDAGMGTAVASSGEVSDFLHRWLGTVTASQGQANLAAFYTDPVSFRGTGALSTPAAVQRQWSDLFGDGGSFGIDWERSAFSEEVPDLSAGVSSACINLPGATGRVIKVRAWATERVQNRPSIVGCRRLEGVYLVRLRHVSGALRICHETWSLHEGICASCPAAPVCRDGGTYPTAP